MALTRIYHASCPRFAATTAGILLALFASARAGIIRPASVSFVDVNTAVASAGDGDTVIIPAGTATWSSTLRITKNITLQGQTTIAGTDPSNFTVTDGTVIKDGLTTDVPLISCIFNPDPGNHNPVIKGITFDGTSSTYGKGRFLLITGSHHSVRVTQCNFWKSYLKYVFWTDGDIWGVMDHCSSTQDSGSEKISTNMFTYGGGIQGDKSWTDDPRFGSDHAWFFEDCAFISVNGKHGGLDAQLGARRVIRHCYLKGVPCALHGTESGGRHRGCRLVENYLNTFELRGNPDITGIQHRAGTGLYWGNTFLTDRSFNRNIELIANRQISRFLVWGGANGENPLDSMDTEGNQTYVAGHAPHLYLTGTVSSISGSTLTISGSTSKDWSGYAITNTNAASANYGNFALILSNAGSVLTLAGQFSGPQPFVASDTFSIYRLGRASLDQPGMGKGDLLTGNPPTNTQWPNQRSEPLYSWLNTNNGSAYTNLLRVAHTPTVQENRDFFNFNTSFDGTTGVGAGLRSARPSTCTKGVGYWATDEKTFYVATANNTWSAYYKPYVYPHPLVSGAPVAPAPPAAPTNLKVVP
jgi:hypothetical protein